MFLLDLILPRGCFSCKDVPKIDESKLLLATTIGFAGIASELRPFEDLSEINRKHREVLRELENRLETFKNKKEDNKMCKSGDKDYWQVGDEVYNQVWGKGYIEKIYDGQRYPISVIFSDKYGPRWFDLNGVFDENTPVSLFHLDAITFDKQGRLMAINYDYTPERTTKVMVTKLPHEFVKGEEVLAPFNDVWSLRRFSHYSDTPLRSYVMTSQYGYKMCIPFKGNEHLKGERVTCESGKIPEDYVFPKQEHEFKPFDKVLVRPSKIATWEIDFFSSYGKDVGLRLRCLSGYYEYCIPFEGNEKLLGTTDNLKD